ncbi:Pentapeptide repeat protein [Kibdelosporangium sp. 4NS15]|uniref:Pentapeptide repeat protein n=1 Tax=Kibdelosporangium persicum TaxID=2698649 RepID=A0ABX2F6I3_9PSEU|nr:pentapeptide repeat-containing protein [Kibdelosporangium persicum]NRN66764.1 Pentapeptide repeat protein [Kibdelosporangium persicum]
MTALTAAGALVFTGLSLGETRRQVEIAERGQVTDRFNRAIDHFASTDELVKLGGIHELDSIARESPRDRAAVTAILAASVRKHRALVGKPCGYDGIDTETHTVLTVLSGLEAGRAVDLRHTCLNLLLLPGARFRCVQLQGSALRGATLIDADLTGAYLVGANFSEPTLPSDHPQGAVLSRARLAGAQLNRARLAHAHLDKADLTQANLSGAVLTGANLSGATLHGADLSGANLTGAVLSGADLSGASITGTVFPAADLTRDDAIRAGAVESPPGKPADRC